MLRLSGKQINPSSRDIVDVFKGYNHNPKIGDGEFYDMQNMASINYPLLSPRKKRGRYALGSAISGLISKDALCYVDGSAFVMNEHRVDMELTEGDKQLISMGAYVIILPDRKYINTADITDYGSIEAVYEGHTLSFSVCDLEGNDITGYTTQQPEEPQADQLWLDAEEKTIKKWSASSGMWVQVSTYVKVSGIGIDQSFEKYDGVRMVGLDAIENGQEDHSELKALTEYQVIWNKGEGYIVVTGLLERPHNGVEGISVTRKMPEMDYVLEYGNRLWGCRYGMQDGQVVNELYASKLGDFKNWSCYMGISTDSWRASLGTDGRFTGAINYLGHPLFFKEGCLHKVYPDSQGAHQVTDIALRGVQAGCERSLAMVGEVLYYKATSGVCAYDGSLPADISKALGGVLYDSAVAGVHGGRYYISMRSTEADTWNLFVYDTEKRMWHREDSLQVRQFCQCREELYALDTEENILTMGGSGAEFEERVPWMAQTGMIGISLPDKKYINRLLLRLSMPWDATVIGYAEYDSSGQWVEVFDIQQPGTGSIAVPIRPVRCDHMRLRLEGTGDIRVFSLTKQICQCSDR